MGNLPSQIILFGDTHVLLDFRWYEAIVSDIATPIDFIEKDLSNFVNVVF